MRRFIKKIKKDLPRLKRKIRLWAKKVYSYIPYKHKSTVLKLAMRIRPSWFLHHPLFQETFYSSARWQRDKGVVFISHQGNGAYCFKTVPDSYVYIPTQKPYRFADILAELGSRPKFSIVVPIYNTPADLLHKMIASVQQQWYPNWELILADDASSLPETKNALGALVDEAQIKIIQLTNNAGIAGATNAAIDCACGEYVVFLDHDDELTDDCLFELVQCINQEDPDFIYSDEDKLTAEGHFAQPHFKPDWSPDTMMGTMYTCHVACVRLHLVQQLGGLRSEFNGCQDWDFILRLSEITDKISHIPKVLYHWRIIPSSTASDLSAKPYVIAASKAVRESALARRGLTGIVEDLPGYHGYFRVNYLTQDNPLISIIIPSRDNSVVLARCIHSIFTSSSYQNYEIILMDNGSVQPATHSYLVSLATKVKVIRHDIPFNFSTLCNVGASQAAGAILLFLNDDTEIVQSDWLERMVGYAQLKHIGAVGAKLLYGDQQTIQHAGVLNLKNGPVHAFLRAHKDNPGYFLRNQIEYNWLAVTGACLMIETEKFKKIGGFDENFPVAYNDVDLCFRLKEANYHNLLCPSVVLIHHESLSRGNDHHCDKKLARLQEDLAKLNVKHPRFFQYDPYFNVNFAPNGYNFDVQR